MLFVPAYLIQVTKLNNGLTVASLETFSPVSEVGVIVRAGSRFETPKKEGITHLLRTCAYQVCILPVIVAVVSLVSRTFFE